MRASRHIGTTQNVPNTKEVDRQEERKYLEKWWVIATLTKVTAPMLANVHVVIIKKQTP